MSTVPGHKFCAVYARGFPGNKGRLQNGFVTYRRGILYSAHFTIYNDPNGTMCTRDVAERLVLRIRVKDPGIETRIMELRSEKYHGGLF